jgi:hypothetical protein
MVVAELKVSIKASFIRWVLRIFNLKMIVELSFPKYDFACKHRARKSN